MSKPGRKTHQGHRLTRTGAVEEFGSEDIGSVHADANSVAQELAACTQMRIRQRATACTSQGSTWHNLKLGRRTIQGIRVTQQLTKQELADGVVRWACRTWVSGSHGLSRSWDHGAERG